MKFIIIAALIAVAVADKDATVVKTEQDVGIDNFNYAYESSNGIKVQQSGNLKGEELQVAGEYAYTAPDGTQVKYTYTADETGYHPVGDLPQPHPIPEYIERAIKLLPVLEQRRR